MNNSSSRPLLLLLLITAAAYLAVVSAGFVWDDHWLIGPQLEQATLADVLGGELWAGTGFSSGLSYYRPLLQLTFYLDWQLFGLSPAGWHLHSLAWHLVSVALLYRVLLELLSDVRPDATVPALAGATVFALHPAQSEAVSWVASRNDPLATAFMLATVLLLSPRGDRLPGERLPGDRLPGERLPGEQLPGDRLPGEQLPGEQLPGGRLPGDRIPGERLPAGRLAGAALCFALALLSKETAFVTPALLLLLDLARGVPPGRDALRRYGALLAVLAGVIVLRRVIGVANLVPDPQEWLIAARRLPTIAGSYGSLLIRPWPLLVTRHLDLMPPGLNGARVIGTLVAPALAVAPLLLKDRRRLLAWAGLAGALLTFAPAMVAIVQYKLLGERYLYLPMAWVSLWVAAMVPGRRGTLAAIAAFAAVSLSLLFLRLPDWQNERALFEADVNRAPNCMNYTWLANSLLGVDQPAEARALLGRVVPSDLTCTEGFRTAVSADLMLRNYPDAVALAEKALQGPLAHSPAFVGQHALALALMGRWDEAEAVAAPAAALAPDGQAAVVLAAGRWRAGDLEAWDTLSRKWQDRRQMATFVARLLAQVNEQEALNRLEATGVDPRAAVAPLPFRDP